MNTTPTFGENVTGTVTLGAIVTLIGVNGGAGLFGGRGAGGDGSPHVSGKPSALTTENDVMLGA